MNLILTVLQIVAPVGSLAGVGFAWVKAGFEYGMEFVSRLAMTLATPCLIFTALMKTELDRSALADTLFAAITAYAVMTVVFWGLTRVLGLERRTYLSPLIFGNTGNLGLPLALKAGHSSLAMMPCSVGLFFCGKKKFSAGVLTQSIKL